jgi:hypothetical protein
MLLDPVLVVLVFACDSFLLHCLGMDQIVFFLSFFFLLDSHVLTHVQMTSLLSHPQSPRFINRPDKNGMSALRYGMGMVRAMISF